MKKISILSMALLLCIGLVSAAAPGFSAIKSATVTGDWKWDGSAWTLPSPQPETAWYNFNAVSPSATVGSYAETEKIGTAWKYSLDMNLYANQAGNTLSGFNAITVNDPATTPATGGYTKYGFYSASIGEFTTSSLVVTGEGALNLGVSTMFDSGFTQINQVRVNE